MISTYYLMHSLSFSFIGLHVTLVWAVRSLMTAAMIALGPRRHRQAHVGYVLSSSSSSSSWKHHQFHQATLTSACSIPQYTCTSVCCWCGKCNSNTILLRYTSWLWPASAATMVKITATLFYHTVWTSTCNCCGKYKSRLLYRTILALTIVRSSGK